MTRFLPPVVEVIFQRIILGILTLFVVSVVIFWAVELLPGTYANAMLGQSATPEMVAQFEKQIGLDHPALTRYGEWVGNLATGDLGQSYSGNAQNPRPVTQIIGPRFYNTLFLASIAALVAVPFAITMGLFCALYRNTWIDRLLSGGSLGLISLPEFLIAYLLIYLVVLRDNFAFTMLAQALPEWASGGVTALLELVPPFPILSNIPPHATLIDRLWSSSLPAITLILVIVAHMMRMTRAAIINVLANPYIEMAKLKGVPAFGIIFSHALPNAWAPIANVVVFNLAYLIVGVVIVEVVFVYPGIGQLMVDAVRTRDIPVVQACAVIFAATYILFNLVADVVTIVTNPRLLHAR